MGQAKHLLTLEELSRDDIYNILYKAKELKSVGRRLDQLFGHTIALIFSKPSTRTRASFEAGIAQLGGSSIYLSPNDLQIGRGETIEDTARVLSSYVDAIVIRTFEQKELEAYASASSVPVINGLSDDFHPCQILADLLTIFESHENLDEVRIAYVGDGNNVASTLALGCAITGVKLVIASPKGYEAPGKLIDSLNNKYGEHIACTDSVKAAVHMADYIYTDVWVSMGQDAEREKRINDLKDYQINDELIGFAAPGAKVMHCLPAHRGEEITASVMDGPSSVVWQQAENRLHAQKALLLHMLGKA